MTCVEECVTNSLIVRFFMGSNRGETRTFFVKLVFTCTWIVLYVVIIIKFILRDVMANKVVVAPYDGLSKTV